MNNDLKKAGKRPNNGPIFKLQNQFWNTPLKRVVWPVLRTNISAACWGCNKWH